MIASSNNIYEKTNRLSEITRITYDKGNRATKVDYLKDNSSETFGYDAAGNRNAAANGNVSYAFTWDRLNRLMQKSDGRGKSLSFSYDKVGNLLSKTNYQGSTTNYLYNAANRLVMLSNPDYLQVDYQHDPAGRLLSRVTSAGARTTYQYDANGWLSKQTQYDAANALISDASYSRDRVGNQLTREDSSGSTTYLYDALYRLQSADAPGTANDEQYSYDRVGNRKTHTLGSLTANSNTRYYKYVAGSNRLADIRIGSVAGTIESSYTYDNEGRLTNQSGIGAKTLAWDAKGRVKSLSAENYSYDPMDYRIGRSGGALGSLDYFLEGEHLESVYQADTLKEKYFRGASTDELVAGYLTGSDGNLTPTLYHHDGVNSVSAVSGHNGGAQQSLTYRAFGTTDSVTGSSPNRLKYTGREEDGTGLYYYRARYYDPSIGRFISEDPLGFGAGDVNFYAYVGNNPVNGNDPSGLTDIIYTPGAVGNANPTVESGNQPGNHYFVTDNCGGTCCGPLYPMGSGTYQRTVVEGRPFDAVINPTQTGNIVNWGVSHIQNNRLFGTAGGNASVAEVAWQSLPGNAWDTKQYLPYTSTFIINGKAEQRDYIGNVIWAAGVNSLGVSQSVALRGGQLQGALSGVSSEDIRDQEAIKFGFGWPGQASTPALSPSSSMPAGSSFLDMSGSGSYGGFLVYPNKPNNNYAITVYKK